MDPAERITSEKALEHEYLYKLHDADDEPDGVVLDDSFEDDNYSVAEWKSNLRVKKQ